MSIKAYAFNPDYYYLSIEATNLHVEVRLNNILMAKLEEGTGVSTDKPLNLWLMPGENKLKVIIRALPGEDSIRGTLRASVYLHDKSFQFPKEGEVYAAIIFPEENDIDEAKEISKEIRFNFNKETKVKLWSEAEEITQLTIKDKNQIIDLIKQLQEALIHGNVAQSVALQNYKIAEDAYASDRNFDFIAKIARENYEWLSNVSNNQLKATPILSENLQFELGSRNKIVCVSKDKEDAIRFDSDDLSFAVPIFVGKIKGVWTIVR